MEYRKIILLDDTTNQLFKTTNCVKINDKSRGTCNAGSQIKFKTSMIRRNLCEYSDA